MHHVYHEHKPSLIMMACYIWTGSWPRNRVAIATLSGKHCSQDYFTENMLHSYQFTVLSYYVLFPNNIYATTCLLSLYQEPGESQLIPNSSHEYCSAFGDVYGCITYHALPHDHALIWTEATFQPCFQATSMFCS